MNGSEGYFLAKREAAEAIHNRVMILEEKRAKLKRDDGRCLFMCIDSQIQALEELRSFIRNVMLWDRKND